MRKVFLGAIVLMTGATLAACGSTNSDGSKGLKAENSSLKTEVKSLKAQIKTQAKGSDSTKNSSENKNKTTASNAVMGKEYVMKDSKGNKLVGITLTQADNKFSGFATENDMLNDPDFNMGKKDNLVQISAKYTNYSVKDGWYPSFDVYDDTGAQSEQVSYEDGGDDVSIGHSATITDWYVLSKPYSQNHKLEIEFSDYLGDSDDEVNAKWVVEQ